jgi:histidyl-tRNA synthetase
MFSNKPIPAVGVSIGIERVFAILEEKSKDDYTVRETETQILIA